MNTTPVIPLKELVTGYPKLAGQMGLIPETAMFRSFTALQAQNVLYLQAELVSLEKELRKCETIDRNDPNGQKRLYSQDWVWLSRSADDGDGEQWQLVQQIRAKLREYNEALIQYSTVLAFPGPSKWDLNYIQHYLATKDMGPLELAGDDAPIWGSTKEPKSFCYDLIALRPRHNEDIFSKWVTERAIIKLFKCGCHRLKKVSRIHGVPGFKDATLLQATFWITTVIASLLPIASISVLYCVHSMLARFAIIAAFNVVVSICLVAFTTAKRLDVFAVTAAFSAVQAVFVGSNYNSQYNGGN
ncbi:hypothetical protein AOQ84DRAFT_399986 [Glonium stellatum]|uniref:DUF6594 domain-containing protein n=1 Tax=Glonium stellatum TaxID=574774 RepID=A0A8E2EU13_9PEZI|nr:hypothetical protein AOQ84DRAFT_399986 [Glonium stellatum]